MAWNKDDFIAYQEHTINDLKRIRELTDECL